jgi:transglutaminase-like putative cysteine protease
LRYRVTHTTTFSYEAPVSHCLNEVRLTPRALPFQKVQQSEIRVEPAPAFLRHRTDYFGNDVGTFAVFEQHAHLTATAESMVDVTTDVLPDGSSISWEAARDLIATQSEEEYLRASEFIYQSPYVPPFPALLKYAQETFTPDRPLLEGVRELSHRIHTEFTYDAKATSIDSPLAEVLRKRRGVCQDFAHVMIGALRALNLWSAADVPADISGR